MTRSAHVTPGSLTSLQAKMGIVVAALFEVFGVVFAAVTLPDAYASEPGMALMIGLFFLIWIVGCSFIIVVLARVSSAPQDPAQASLIDVQFDDPVVTNQAAPKSDFDDRLRKLEGLKRDGLISDTEYRSKRSRILDENW